MVEGMKMNPSDQQNNDDRVIANMNIEGMPWYSYDKNTTTASPSHSHEEEQKASPYAYEEPLDKKETRTIIGSALLAGLMIGGIFLLGAFLFILFCNFIWLK